MATIVPERFWKSNQKCTYEFNIKEVDKFTNFIENRFGEKLIIEKKNEVYITVDCDPNIQREISEFFTFYVPGYKFMPAFRTRMWDGKIRLFSQKTKKVK